MTSARAISAARLSVVAALAIAAPARAQQSDRPALPAWVQVGGELRDRVEGFAGAGFTPGRDDAYDLTRLKLDVTSRPAERVAFKIQLQDSRPFKKEVGPIGAPYRDVLNFHLAYAEIGDVGRDALAFRVGRQELAFGDERLVGAAGWLNAPRAFDAVRATIRRAGVQVDAFGASVVRTSDDMFRDSSGHGSTFFGVYASANGWLPSATVQPFTFWKSDRVGEVTTVGARVTGELPAKWDYATEIAVQGGAFGGHWRVRRTWSKALRAFGEYNYASPAFDALYQTAHEKYGLADQIGWRNLRHVRSSVEMTPHARITVAGSYHSWWLSDVSAGLYSAAGALVAAPTSPSLDAHVGQEVDGQATIALWPQLRAIAGVAHVFPGAYLARATSGASYTYPFAGLTYVFALAR